MITSDVRPLESRDYCFVSFDIIGHSFDSDLAVQTERVADLNALVRDVLDSPAGAGAIWASGGDGGHLALPPATDPATALEFITKVRDWSIRREVPLRVVAHVGPAVAIDGADGRVQLVGDGINMCGHLLDFASAGAVVVSQRFREFVQVDDGSAVRFAGPVPVYMKKRVPDSVYLLSVEGRFSSQWGDSVRSEHELVRQTERDLAALDSGGQPARPGTGTLADLPHGVAARKGALAWKIVYHAKRLLQSNTSDRIALEALENVALREDLPDLFRGWDPAVFGRFVQTAELVERRHGETLCREGDEGDAMFVVLTGEVGVATTASGIEQRLDLRMGPGVVLGELAVVLKGSRTATLQAVGDTSALSFNYEQCRQFLEQTSSAKTVQAGFDALFRLRLSEFVCNHCPSLVGMDRAGPLASIPATRLSRYVMSSLTRIELERGTVISPASADVGAPGLYVLVRGELKSRGVTLSARDNLPILYAELPGELVHMNQEFQVGRSSAATVLHLDAEVFDRLDDETDVSLVEQVAAAVKRSLLGHYQFDVFLSYNRRDRDLAEQLKAGLVEAGLRVFLDEPAPGLQFTPALTSALLTSLTFVPLISSHVEPSSRADERSWVEMEIAFRRAAFDAEPNMLPIRTEGGDAHLVAGVTQIDAAGRSDAAVIAAVAEAVRRRSAPVPFATRRQPFPPELDDA